MDCASAASSATWCGRGGGDAMEIEIFCSDCAKELDISSYVNSYGNLIILVDPCGCKKNEVNEVNKEKCIEKL